MRSDMLARLNRVRDERQAAVVITDLASGEAEVVLERDVDTHPLAHDCLKALRSGKAALVEHGSGSRFLNPYLPPAKILVIGAVHISQALARLAPIAGYDLAIVDPRTAFATEERFHGVELVAEWPEEVLKSRPLDAYTALVAVTHDPKIDDLPLSEALKASCFYVGALGSRKTHSARVERLRQMGHPAEEIDRIAAPIGLDIGASSPAEIAVAILAQIIQALRRRDITGSD
jgi:xanthine dehydrogenase accessory factor